MLFFHKAFLNAMSTIEKHINCPFRCYLYLSLPTPTLRVIPFCFLCLTIYTEKFTNHFYRLTMQFMISDHIYVTGPPGALLFDTDQRLHWNNHYNCCFVQLATLGINCTDFLSQIMSQVEYPMQFMVMRTRINRSN